jgi:hypothetical protein
MREARSILGAPVFHLTRAPLALSALLAAAEAAGLHLDFVEAGWGALPRLEALPPLESASAAARRTPPCTQEQLHMLLADPEVSWLTLGGRSPGWCLRLPLVPGMLYGSFAPEALDLRARPAANLLGLLFDTCLVEWGLVGSRKDLAPILQRTPSPEEPLHLPTHGTVRYRSVDLLGLPDPLGSADLADALLIRTHTGGALFLPGAPEPGPLVAWRPPPVERIPLAGAPPLRLRDISPGLAHGLTRGAEVIRKQVLAMGARALPLTVEGLAELESFLLPVARHLSPYLLACWGTFAGEVAVALGGRWRRWMSPESPFPSNLVVQLGGHDLFAPHMLLQALLEGRSALPLATVLQPFHDGVPGAA